MNSWPLWLRSRREDRKRPVPNPLASSWAGGARPNLAHLLPSGATEPCTAAANSSRNGQGGVVHRRQANGNRCRAKRAPLPGLPKVEIGSGGEPALHEAVKPELGAERQAIQSEACSVAKTDAARAADRTTLSRLLEPIRERSRKGDSPILQSGQSPTVRTGSWQRLEQLVRANYHARTGLQPLLPSWGQDRPRVPSGSPGQCLAVHAGEVQTARAGLPPCDSKNERPEAPVSGARGQCMFARERKKW